MNPRRVLKHPYDDSVEQMVDSVAAKRATRTLVSPAKCRDKYMAEARMKLGTVCTRKKALLSCKHSAKATHLLFLRTAMKAAKTNPEQTDVELPPTFL